jgi:cytochrome c-type biogenesis protein CcmH
MTAFVIAAALCAAAALLFIALPWVRAAGGGRLRDRLLPVLVALAVVAVAMLLYAHLSTWPWQKDTAASAAPGAIATLKRATEEQPDNLNNWLQLGQAYSQIEQFSLARSAFERANRLSAGTSAEALSGMAETLALAGDGSNAPKVEELFNRALQIDPRSPKALFYTALSALHDGNLQVAHDRFSTMLSLNPPADVRSALEKQIAELDAQLKPAAVDPRTAVRVQITVAAGLRARYEASVSAGATLFVFVRGPEGGPPLAVKRLATRLPQTIALSAADAMIAGNAIKPGQRVRVAARLSTSGSPLAQPGDLSGEMLYVAGKDGERELAISQIAP